MTPIQLPPEGEEQYLKKNNFSFLLDLKKGRALAHQWQHEASISLVFLRLSALA